MLLALIHTCFIFNFHKIMISLHVNLTCYLNNALLHSMFVMMDLTVLKICILLVILCQVLSLMFEHSVYLLFMCL